MLLISESLATNGHYSHNSTSNRRRGSAPVRHLFNFLHFQYFISNFCFYQNLPWISECITSIYIIFAIKIYNWVILDIVRYPYIENTMGLPERTNEAAGSYAKACVAVANECQISAIDLWSKMQKIPNWQTECLW